MRIGSNPNVKAEGEQWGKVVACVITHLPELKGYHEKRLEVVQCCLETMRANLGMDAQVLVWDNGSCDELRDWLRDEYQPDYLFMAPNMGKATARANIVSMLPDNTIVAVADDDMLFHPGWLRAQVELLQHFPNVGQVSGYPVRTTFRWGVNSTLSWAKKNAQLDMGKFIPAEWDLDFCNSIGRDYQYQKETTVHDYDYRVTYLGKSAYTEAHHAQWVGYAGVIRPFCVRSNQAMRTEHAFDNAVDGAGLLRLTTIERYSQHIGNVMEPKLKAKWQEYLKVEPVLEPVSA